MRRVALACLFLLVLISASGERARADEPYPSKPIRLVLPQPAGGAVDLIARALGDRLSYALRQPVIVENQPGANGGLAAGQVARAAPDGYTLLMAVDTNLVVNPNLYPNLAYGVHTRSSSMAEGITGWRLHVGVIFPTPVPPRAVLEFYEAVPEGVDMTTVSLTIQQLSDDDMDEAIKGMERAAKQLASFDVDLIYQSGSRRSSAGDQVSATSSPTVCRRPRAGPRSPTCRA